MISQTNSSTLQSVYAGKSGETKSAKQDSGVAKQNDLSKVEELKESIDSGDYKVNIDALSQKMADELL